MKKSFLTLLGILFLSGCVSTMNTDEYSTLKIKVLNLETTIKEQDKRINELQQRLSQTEKKLGEEVANRFLEAQSKLLSEVSDLKKDLQLLQSKFEDMQFQREAQSDLQAKTLEDINTRLSALELKIKELESKTEGLSKGESLKPNKVAQANQTTTETPKVSTKEPTSNQTQGAPEKPKEKLTEADLYQQAFILFDKGDLKGAKKLWEEYLRLYPKGKWVPQTHFYLGEIYFKEKDYEAAILEYQKLIETPGPNPLKPKAMLRQAEAFLALKDKKAAEILLKKVIKNYPGSKEAKEAETILKRLR
ncbi:MAG: tetratricopeptide repeat protein [Caldimicrobium sp.]